MSSRYFVAMGIGICCLAIGPQVYGQGFTPVEAESRMQVAEGLQVRLVASEPQVRQPILVKVDDRGRLWTIQYLQYPNPAGLKRTKIDRWSRTVYDRIPKPPPHGPRGADRISILEDTDGDGRVDRCRDFVDGLNLATGLAFGHGGVFVLQVPYLLFYPDRDRDDVPDSDPQVLLEGFGMEDAQSLANHLTWGPDGWLYGVNGSTTTCHIRGIEFQQGVWRYHPLTKHFELFCEGGGNTFGLTFDVLGNLFYSTNGGPFVHAWQGAYYYKSFGKHGPLHNRFAYGYFGPLQRDQVPGGPPTGGTIYLGQSFPDRFRHAFIAGNFLGHSASWWYVKPRGSTFSANFSGRLLDARDTWFGPTDICLSPDGSLYICDFYDRRTSHPDPDAAWDRTNGRIYRIEGRSGNSDRIPDIRTRKTAELVELLRHPNAWYATRARVELASRKDPAAIPLLRSWLTLNSGEKRETKPDLDRSRTTDRPTATPSELAALWGLHASDGIDLEHARYFLAHSDPAIRSWMVRILGDSKTVADPLSGMLRDLAASDNSVAVRCQLAATARRLPANQGWPVMQHLLARELDRDDPFAPLLLWWGLEQHVMSQRDALVRFFGSPGAWKKAGLYEHRLRLVRRWAADGTAAGYDACLQLLNTAPLEQRKDMHVAAARGLSERATDLGGIGQGGLFSTFARPDRSTADEEVTAYDPVTIGFRTYLHQWWQTHPNEPSALHLALLTNSQAAYQHLKQQVAALDQADQLDPLFKLLEQFGQPDCLPVVLASFARTDIPQVQLAGLRVLARFDDPRIGNAILDKYPAMSTQVRFRAREILFSRVATARIFLKAIAKGHIDSKEVELSQLRMIALHQNAALDAEVQKFWGNIQPGTTEEKLAIMRRYNNDLRTGAGDAQRGKVVFRKLCATCHQLFGEGTQLGPDLTSSNRKDSAALLANLVDPSAVIRRDYLQFAAITDSGRVVNGLLVKEDAASVTLADAKNQKTRISRKQLVSLRAIPTSLMPNGLLAPLTPQQRRDLFRYLAQ